MEKKKENRAVSIRRKKKVDDTYGISSMNNQISDSETNRRNQKMSKWFSESYIKKNKFNEPEVTLKLTFLTQGSSKDLVRFGNRKHYNEDGVSKKREDVFKHKSERVGRTIEQLEKK